MRPGTHRWTRDEEIALLDGTPIQEIAERAGVSMNAAYIHRSELINGHATARTNAATKAVASRDGRAWTEIEDDFVRDTMYEPLVEVAEVLGRTYLAVKSRRFQIRNGEKFNYSNGIDIGVTAPSGERRQPQFTPPLCPSCYLEHAGECF